MHSRLPVSSPTGYAVRPLGTADRDRVIRITKEHWGADFVIAHGVVYLPHELPGFVAEDASGETAGLVTYSLRNRECKVLTLNVIVEGAGVGTALLDAVLTVASDRGCSRVWLVTTNDNRHALDFYRRRGYELASVHRGALEHSRRLKPSIPLVSPDGIPMRDEIELELRLPSRRKERAR